MIVKGSSEYIHSSGIWAIYGRRLDNVDIILECLKRDTKEWTNLDVEIVKILNKQSFVRDDGQKIYMNIFLCKAINQEVQLSEEHSDFEWVEINKVKEKLINFFHEEIDIFTSFS